MSSNLGVPVVEKGKYYFISYSSIAAERIKPYILNLHKAGFPLWYDHGISYGDKWEAEINKKIEGCESVILFVTKDIYKNKDSYVIKEFNIAKKYTTKKIYVIKIDDLKPPQVPVEKRPWDSDINELQNIISKTYNTHDLILEILKATGEKECLEKWEKLKAGENNRKSKEKVRIRFQKKKKTIPVKLDVFHGCFIFELVLVLCIVLLPVAIDQVLPVKINENIKFSKRAKEICLSNEWISNVDLENINKLKKVETYTFIDCDFAFSELSDLEGLSRADVISLDGCSNIENYSWISQLKDGVSLQIMNSDFSDEDIQELGLSNTFASLCIKNCDNFKDLRVLSDTKIENLDISRTSVEDLGELAKQEQLKSVIADECPIKDISPLSSLENLVELSFNNCKIENITDTFYSLRLEKLSFDKNDLYDVSGFDELTILSSVSFAYNNIELMDCIMKSAKTIKRINFCSNPLSEELLNQISTCIGTEELDLSYIPLRNTSVIKNMKGLTILSLKNCELTNVDDLAGLAKIKDLYLQNNNITCIPSLKKLKMVDIIDLSNNGSCELKDLPRKGIRVLNIVGTFVDLNSLAHHTEDNNCSVFLISEYDDQYINGTMARKNPFSKYFIFDVPLDRRVSLEDLYGEKIELVDRAELKIGKVSYVNDYIYYIMQCRNNETFENLSVEDYKDIFL